MLTHQVLMPPTKRIALIAHDNMKGEMLEWARFNRDLLAEQELFATETTGTMVAEALDLPVTLFRSGPLGGDQQVGAAIADGEIDFLIFFWDPLAPHPHDVDVRALLRIAVVYNIPIACNRSSADFLISSNLMSTRYRHMTIDYPAIASTRIRRPERRAG